MFGLCAFFAFVLTVVCEVPEETPTGFGPELNGDVVDFLQKNIDEGWSNLIYEVYSETKAKDYLQCTYQPGGDESKCKNDHGISTLVYGFWNGAVESPGQIFEKVEYWSSGGEDGGISILKTAIKKAKEDGAKNVGCAFYYTVGKIYSTTVGDDAIGDVACVFD